MRLTFDSWTLKYPWHDAYKYKTSWFRSHSLTMLALSVEKFRKYWHGSLRFLFFWVCAVAIVFIDAFFLSSYRTTEFKRFPCRKMSCNEIRLVACTAIHSYSCTGGDGDRDDSQRTGRAEERDEHADQALPGSTGGVAGASGERRRCRCGSADRKPLAVAVAAADARRRHVRLLVARRQHRQPRRRHVGASAGASPAKPQASLPGWPWQ